MFKWLSLKKFSLMAFKWSKEESELLTSLVKYNFNKYLEKWGKKIGKNYLNNFIYQTTLLKKFSELQNNADNIGTVTLIH